jgi:hypothetical protein
LTFLTTPADSLTGANGSGRIEIGHGRPGRILSRLAVVRTNVGPQTGHRSQAHIGYIISGHMIVRPASGTEVTIGPGDAFEVGAMARCMGCG